MKKQRLTVWFIMVLMILGATPVLAGLGFGEDGGLWGGLEFGLLSGAGISQDSYANDTSNFSASRLRLYADGRLHDRLSFEVNIERDSEGNTEILDGVAKLDFTETLHVWLGRFQPPIDRMNVIGSYLWGDRDLALSSKYPGIVGGRDNGAVVWGLLGQNRFKYQAGVFQGNEGISTEKQEPLFISRLSYNFWDKETDYYHGTTYIGTKDILSLGGSVMSREDNRDVEGDFLGWNLEFLCEKNLSGRRMVTLEAGFNHYEKQGVSTTPSDQAWFVLGGYLIHGFKGKLRSIIEHHESDDVGGVIRRNSSVGLHYYPDILNMIVSAVYALETAPGEKVNHFSLGFQVRL